MDLEIYERFRATLLLAGITLVSFLLMAFPQAPAVRSLKTILVHASSPMHSALVRLQGGDDTTIPALPTEQPEGPRIEPSTDTLATTFTPHKQSLVDENVRLRALLSLQERRWPKGVPASVIGRDPHRWFQELVIDKGAEDGLSVNDPVVAAFGSDIGLVGRIVEAEPRVSRVMLLQDSLSAVAATILGKDTEDGVAEGSDQHEVVLKYLDRNSTVKIGDAVVTSGLGQRFPPGIPIGIVEDLSLDPRQLFLQARLRPMLQGHAIHYVLVLSEPARPKKQ